MRTLDSISGWSTESAGLLSGTGDSEGSRYVGTGAAHDDALASALHDSFREEWNSVIDHKLIEWGRDQDRFRDDENEPPSHAILSDAYDFAKGMCQAGHAAPTRVVMDGDGGLSFEQEFGNVLIAIEFDSDGSVEFIRFEDLKIVETATLR